MGRSCPYRRPDGGCMCMFADRYGTPNGDQAAIAGTRAGHAAVHNGHASLPGIPLVCVPFSFEESLLNPFFLRQLGQIILCHQKMQQVRVTDRCQIDLVFHSYPVSVHKTTVVPNTPTGLDISIAWRTLASAPLYRWARTSLPAKAGLRVAISEYETSTESVPDGNKKGCLRPKQ